MISLTAILKEYVDQSFRDNPRKAIKANPEYQKLVNEISKIKDTNKTKTVIERWIKANESEFADLIFCKTGEKYINCEHAAEMVSQILSDAGKKHKLQVGNVQNQSHAWVNYNGTIIDPTKDQFKDITPSEYLEDVYYEKDM